MKLATSLYPNRLALAEERFRGEGVELGVAEGDFSAQILRNEGCRRLWGIDSWSDHHGLAEYRAAAERLAAAGKGRCVVLRMTFEEALPLLGDASLDFVYVDGYAHTGQEAGRTIEQWWRKVKPGGVLAGHDYHPRWPRTVSAVDAFAERYSLSLNLTLPAGEAGADRFPSWWVEQPSRSSDES